MPPRAIGPKLAEQAVLVVRANGARSGSPAAARGRGVIQIPDHPGPARSRRALRAPPLRCAPARGGGAAPLPRHEGRHRPADRERLLLRLRVSGADRRGGPRRDSRTRSGARSARAGPSSAGRSTATRPGGSSRRRASPTRSSSWTPPTARSPSTARATSPTSAAVRTSRTPIRSGRSSSSSLAGAYWRGDERNPQLTRIYGTAFYDPAGSRRSISCGSRRRRAVTTGGSDASSTSSTSTSTRPARRSGIPGAW